MVISRQHKQIKSSCSRPFFLSPFTILSTKTNGNVLGVNIESEMKLKKNKLEDRSKGKHFLHNFYILLILNEDTQLFYVLRFRPLCFFYYNVFAMVRVLFGKGKGFLILKEG